MTFKNHGPGGCCCGGDCCAYWVSVGTPGFEQSQNGGNDFHPLWPATEPWIVDWPTGTGPKNIYSPKGGSVAPIFKLGRYSLGYVCSSPVFWNGHSIQRFGVKMSHFPASFGFMSGQMYTGSSQWQHHRRDYFVGTNLLFHFDSPESATVARVNGGTTVSWWNFFSGGETQPFPMTFAQTPSAGMSGEGFYLIGGRREITPVDVNEIINVELHTWNNYWNNSTVANLYVQGQRVYQWMMTDRMYDGNTPAPGWNWWPAYGFYAGWNHTDNATAITKSTSTNLYNFAKSTCQNSANDETYSDCNPDCEYTFFEPKVCWTATARRLSLAHPLQWYCESGAFEGCEEADKEVWGETFSASDEFWNGWTSVRGDDTPFTQEPKQVAATGIWGDVPTVQLELRTNKGPGFCYSRLQHPLYGTQVPATVGGVCTIDGYSYEAKIRNIDVIYQNGMVTVNFYGLLEPDDELLPPPPPPTYVYDLFFVQETMTPGNRMVPFTFSSDDANLYWGHTVVPLTDDISDTVLSALVPGSWSITIT